MTVGAVPDALLKAASLARQKAYAPYSNFAVGAAVEAGSGNIYSGCNVENAAYGLTNCAERTAIFNAVSCGESELVRILVLADTTEPIAPCGACRQVMWEFNIREVVLCNMNGECKIFGLTELLPYAFGSETKERGRKE